jgi:adenosylhomocysteine nucleosidase
LALHRLARRPYPLFEGLRNGQPIIVLQTGAGPQRAREAVSWLLASHPCRGILSVGLSGGLQASLPPGSVVIGNRWVALEGRPLVRRTVGPPKAHGLLDGLLRAAAGGGVPPHEGWLLTVDRLVSSVEEKRRLAAETGAAAVDMEGGALAERALAADVEPAAMRVILDDAHESLDARPLRWLRSDGSLSFRRCGLAVAAQPTLLPVLWRLGRRSTRAMALVARWLCRFFDEMAPPAA